MHLFEHRALGVQSLGVMLREVSGYDIVAKCNHAGIRLDFLRQELEQRGLARPVESDHRDAIAA